MRELKVEISHRELIIYEWSDMDPNHPDFYDDTPVHLSIEEAVETIEMDRQSWRC